MAAFSWGFEDDGGDGEPIAVADRTMPAGRSQTRRGGERLAGEHQSWRAAVITGQQRDLGERDALGPAGAQRLHAGLLGGPTRGEALARIAQFECVTLLIRRIDAVEEPLSLPVMDIRDTPQRDEIGPEADDHGPPTTGRQARRNHQGALAASLVSPHSARNHRDVPGI